MGIATAEERAKNNEGMKNEGEGKGGIGQKKKNRDKGTSWDKERLFVG